MSHTSEVSDILFTDIAALTAAVNELSRSGLNISLTKGGTPRAYYQTQEGMGPASYVVKLEDAPYDVGIYKHPSKNGYVARTDLFMGHVARILGGKVSAGEKTEQAALGKLYQTYGIHAATRKAVSQGMTVQRVNNKDGSVRLVVGGFK